jgi:deazaflavin-dependent oxidoreductase (nitroreductase family)
MNLQQSMTDIGFKVLSESHRALLRLSGGRICIGLRDAGRRVAHHRAQIRPDQSHDACTSPLHDENRVVLVASKGGNDRNPQWYGNLTANPDVEIVIRGQRGNFGPVPPRPTRARSCGRRSSRPTRDTTATRSKTARHIPVIICEPRPA